jgi:hypothetical protein
MYAARERSASETDRRPPPNNGREDDEHPSPKKDLDNQPTSKERFGAAYSDSEGSDPSEYGSALSDQDPYGSQYSSEGELYNLETDGESAPSEDSETERFGAIREISSDYDSDSCPSARSESDSDEESEEDSEKAFTFSKRLGVMIDNLFVEKPHYKGMATLRKSSKKISRPPRSEKDNRCFVAKMKLHNLEAFVLLDSGCTSDSVSPEFATSANLKAHELDEPVPLQLGTVGSRSKINFGLFTDFEIGKIKDTHYFDIVNIDRYDVILGTVFMRKHGITLDFERDEVRVKGRVLDTIIEGPNSFKQARRHAMRPHPPKDE